MNAVQIAHRRKSEVAHESLPALGSESWTGFGPVLETLSAAVAERFAETPAERDDLRQIVLLSLFDAVDRFDPGSGLDFGQFAAARIVRGIRDYRSDWLFARIRGGAPAHANAAPVLPRPLTAGASATPPLQPSGRLCSN